MTDDFDDQMTGYSETVETHVEQRNLGGRPIGATKLKMSDEIVKQIEGLARIQCTMKEAGAVLGVNETTYSRFLQAHEKALEAWEHGKETGKASLRRNQYKMSETNPTMAIWLGKQMLDQRDKIDENVNMKFIPHEQAIDALD